MPWNPGQYLKYAEPRLRPALELPGRVDHDGPTAVVDLGCGTGIVTALLAARWPDAAVGGIDSSPEMLAEARRDHPGLAWTEVDIAERSPQQPVDVVFSNATITKRCFRASPLRWARAACWRCRCPGTTPPRRTPWSAKRWRRVRGGTWCSRCCVPTPSPGRASTTTCWHRMLPTSTSGRLGTSRCSGARTRWWNG